MKIAVVTATYQRGDGNTPLVLTRAIESLKKQAHTDWKFFLIGDAYADQNEFNSFSNLLPSNKIYTENLPVSIERALEEGFDYIALLDHDDLWYPDHLQLINEGIEKTKSPFIFTRGFYEVSNGISVGIPYHGYESEKFEQLRVNVDNPIKLNYGFNGYACFPYECIFLKTSVCLDCRLITLRMRDCLEETGKSSVGDADWWLRIREEMIEGKYKPALFIDHITCANIDEGYSKTNT